MPGLGEVRIAVRAAGINPVDWKRYGGTMGSDAKLPLRLGFEVAGVVVEVGSEAVGPAGRVAVGDEVIAYRIDGGYAEEVVVPASEVVPKPAAMAWEAAGGLMLAGATAVHALTATAVSAQETVLVHAAAGGVGLMAVQLAVARGARVIGTASERNHPYLRELGAEPTTYGEGLADRVRGLAPNGVDAAIDCVGTDEAVDVSLELVADRDRIASIAAFPRGAGSASRCSVVGRAQTREPRCATPLACSSPHSSRRESSRSVPARSSSTRLPKPIARGKLATSPASSCSFRTPSS